MPSNAVTAALIALIAAIAPVLAAIVVMFKLNLTQDQQAQLVAGLAAVVTVGGVVYAAFVTHASAKVTVAKHQAESDLSIAQVDAGKPIGSARVRTTRAK